MNFREEEKKQKEILRKLKEKISPEGWGKLKEAQKIWKTYRKVQCDFEVFAYRDGSIYPEIYASCAQWLTVQQNKHLLDQLNCEEGNFCGGQ